MNAFGAEARSGLRLPAWSTNFERTVTIKDRDALPGVIATIVYLALAALAFVCWRENPEAIIVFATGLVILWYTWETYLLRRAAWAQRELDMQPLVIIEKVDPRESGGAEFQVRNLGRGVALNVSVDDVVLLEEGSNRYLIRFEQTFAFLEAGQRERIASHAYNGDTRIALPLHASLDPRWTTFESTILVRFSNAEMKGYLLTQTIAPRTFAIVGMAVAKLHD